MTASALIATQLTDHSSRAKLLTIAGFDVIKQPGMDGNGYGVPIDSVQVAEQGPGGISSLTFDFEDPLATSILPLEGDEVLFWDITNDVPLFAGFVKTWRTRPAFGNQGRITSIQCDGFEVILDWAVLTADLVIPALTEGSAAVQMVAANAEGTRSLRAFAAAPGVRSNQAGPVSNNFLNATGYSVTIAAGTSLREALRQVGAAINTQQKFSSSPSNVVVSVDFYRGLRAMADSATGQWASDFASLTVTDTLAGANAADSLDHETDASQIVRGVFIQGLNAAGTGYLGDGSGRPGRIAFMSDPSIDTAAKLADAQATYLNQYVVGKRGSFSLDDWTPTAGVRVGSTVVLTDTVTGATGTHRIYGLTKRFMRSGRETWSVAYGGLRPSARRLIRRLTRSTRS